MLKVCLMAIVEINEARMPFTHVNFTTEGLKPKLYFPSPRSTTVHWWPCTPSAFSPSLHVDVEWTTAHVWAFECLKEWSTWCTTRLSMFMIKRLYFGRLTLLNCARKNRKTENEVQCTWAFKPQCLWSILVLSFGWAWRQESRGERGQHLTQVDSNQDHCAWMSLVCSEHVHSPLYHLQENIV